MYKKQNKKIVQNTALKTKNDYTKFTNMLKFC